MLGGNGAGVDEEKITCFEHLLIEDEKCAATRDKYVRDVRKLLAYVGESGRITKEIMIAYKQYLVERYAVATVNGILASVNSFLKKMNWYDCVVKSLKVQREAFRSRNRELTREEYYRLLCCFN